MGILEDIDGDAGQGITEDQDKGFARLKNVTIAAMSERAVKVKFPDGRVRWVPKSQIEESPDGESMDLVVGSTGTMVIPKWLANKMDEEASAKPNPKVSERQDDDVWLDGVVVLRETDRALLVRVPGAKEDEIWLPKNQVREGSQCQHDGDRGTLVISHWIAGEKKLLGVSSKKAKPTPPDDDSDIPF